MSQRTTAALLAAAMLGVTNVVIAGTTNAFTFYPSSTSVATALSDPVTYSTPALGKKEAMQTYVGIQVGDPTNGLMKNTSGNTVNAVSIRFTATITDPAEKLVLHQPEAYVPAGCTWNSETPNAVSIVCSFGQIRNGGSIPAFTVFYVGPQKVCQADPCVGGDDDENSDFVSTKLQVLYSEALNGPTNVWDNSNQVVSQANLITLGTFNPVNVKSAVPKSGAKVSTGSAGVPVPESVGGQNSQFAEKLTVPALGTAYTSTVAEMNVFKMTDADAPTVTPANIANCINNGRFVSCPVFATSVAQNGVETRFLDPANPLRIVYRVDASNLKLSAPKILNSVVILYTGKKFDAAGNIVGDWVDEPLKVCLVKDTPDSTDGLPCINGSKCYKKNDTGGIPELENDCEWESIGTANGYGKLQ